MFLAILIIHNIPLYPIVVYTKIGYHDFMGLAAKKLLEQHAKPRKK